MPAPPEGWVARDVVRHLVEWFPGFLQSGAGVRLPAGPSVDVVELTRSLVDIDSTTGDCTLAYGNPGVTIVSSALASSTARAGNRAVISGN